jgi:tetratricopeptide (TPR) repeat protein
MIAIESGSSQGRAGRLAAELCLESSAMLRLIGFFLLVFAAMFVLRELPVVGGIFRIPLLGFYITAILVSVVGARLAARAADRSKQRRLARQLGDVDTPYNRGKLGLLLLQQGRAAKAVPHLAAALEADPVSEEFQYRLGLALLQSGESERSAEQLEALVARNEDYAYGAALLALSNARFEAGSARGALDAIEQHDRSFGPTPESCYHRGRALRAIGDRGGAARAFESIGSLASKLPAYQRRAATKWWFKAQLAKLGF